MKENDKPILVVGGGMVGLSLALSLSQRGFKVTLIDRRDYSTIKPDVLSARVSALSDQNVTWLKQLQVWDRIDAEMRSPYRKMRVWDDLGGGEVEFNAAECAAAQLGYIVNNEAVILALYHAVQQSSCCIRQKVTLQHLSQNENGVVLTTDQGVFEGRLLIGADGVRSWVRSKLPLAVTTRRYPHQALTAVVETEKPHGNTALQSFLPTGPLGVLPLHHPRRVAIVWSCSAERAAQLTALSHDELNIELTNSIQCQLGHMKCVQAPVSHVLLAKSMKTYYYLKTIVIGDAAHAIHPLAGQGANLGLEDAAVLSQLIEPYGHKRTIEATFRHYQRRRALDHRFMSMLMRFLVEGFDSTNPGVVAFRSHIMTSVNRLKILKKVMMSKMKVGQ